MSSLRSFWWLGLGLLFSSVVGAKAAQFFHLNTSQVDVVVAVGINPLPVKVPVVAGTGGLNLAVVGAVSDATWVTPAVDVPGSAITLNFATTSLAAGTHTATITVNDTGGTEQFLVRAVGSTLNVVSLTDDPMRSRTYALHQNGLENGALIIFDPIQSIAIGSLTLAKKPTDMAVSADANELAVICSASKALSMVDLQALKVAQTIALPAYEEWGQADTSANVEYGAGNVIYYTDGSWGPVLRVFNRQTNTVVQSIYFDGVEFTGNGNWNYGFGDIAVSPDKTSLYAWSQYGWNAGYPDSSAGKFSIGADGKVALVGIAQLPAYPAGLTRDPLNTPALVSRDGSAAVLKQYAFSNGYIAAAQRVFPAPIYAISPNAEVASTATAIYDRATGSALYTLPVSAPVQAYTSDYSRLVYFDSAAAAIKTIDLLQAIGAEKLGVQTSPADGRVVQAPSKLQWSPVLGGDSYRVYFGTSSSAVVAADVSSPLFLGQVTASAYTLTQPLTAGTTYYWRVDAVNGGTITPGAVKSFTVSTISASPMAINASALIGYPSRPVSLTLSSVTPGAAWTLTSTQSWIQFSASSGVTPATVQVTLDASQFTTGTHAGSIEVTSAGQAFSIPVSLRVDPLAITAIRSAASSTKVYAISEASATGEVSPAYLLEIDAGTEKITRMVPAGMSVTDLAIHAADNRIYVTNWKSGGILGVNMTTFESETTIPSPPHTKAGFSTKDAYRVAAGKAGRLITEAADLTMDVQLYDTTTGSVLSTTSEREGGGQFEPTGRYYYHGDNNSSSSLLSKIDTQGDVLSVVKSANTYVGVNYNGSRSVVVAANGSRVFWNGGMFDADLNLLWYIADTIVGTSADGKYAFGAAKIYDVAQRKPILSMPLAVNSASAHNAAASKLVAQVGSKLMFFPLGDTITLPAPELSQLSVSSNRVELAWTDRSLEEYFSIQMRIAGAATWTDLPFTSSANTVTRVVDTLVASTTYEFRVRAYSTAVNSDWSNVLTVTTPAAGPYGLTQSRVRANDARLEWGLPSVPHDAVIIERTRPDLSEWTQIASLPAGTITYTDKTLQPLTVYRYRVKTVREGLSSDYSSVTQITTIAADTVPPTMPTNLTAQPFIQQSLICRGQAPQIMWGSSCITFIETA